MLMVIVPLLPLHHGLSGYPLINNIQIQLYMNSRHTYFPVSKGNNTLKMSTFRHFEFKRKFIYIYSFL